MPGETSFDGNGPNFITGAAGRALGHQGKSFVMDMACLYRV
ncbi:hypothetical protein GMO_27020 [Gluconobacter morbifer G707]|uniref:Uncharacterized protein n=1 Tax=Gluconobacter morbifer G707 TaxID=1088869 RepID=G6XMI4_9PROT|nr:hypothetical protein GMO_27020 [Gluconobacter morbifer G707]